MEQQEFSIEKRKKGDVVILDVVGHLTIGPNDQAFKESVSELVSKKQNKILVNLASVDFMDSSGVGALVKSYTTVTNAGGKFKLLQAGKMIRQTLKSTGLLGIFEVFDDESTAVASF